MANRSANSSIKGFEYQLLQSLNIILKSYNEQQNKIIEIEGIEDLDVHNEISTDFYQFKYYAKTKVTHSTYQKAIAYLFCNWKSNPSKENRYKLFVHTTSKINSINVKELEKILSLKDASKIINAKFQDFKFESTELLTFLSVFEFKNVPSYEQLKDNVWKLSCKIFETTENFASLFYIPSMMNDVHNIAVEDESEKRKIVVNDFIKSVKLNSIDLSKIIRLECETTDNLIMALKDHLEHEHSFKNIKYSYILQFGSCWSAKDVVELVTFLVPLFVSQGKRIDNFPLTFGIEIDSLELKEIKSRLIQIKTLKMNDGYETVHFLPDFFSEKPLYLTNKNGSKYEDKFSYNFRLCNLDNCNRSLVKIEKPFVFCFDTSPKFDENIPYIQLEKFSFQSIKILMGELVK